MKYFLQETARDILAQHGDHLVELCLVFPNRRAGVFFKRYLANELNQPVWSPSILTISDLMQDLSGLQKADHLSLLFDLHQIFQQQKKTREPFDEFYHWGEMLLHDFDDIDKYLVDPRDVFRNLASLKSIDEHFSYLSEEQIEAIRQFWSTFQVHPPSREQKDFISIWEILYNVYLYFNQLLDEKGHAYEGKIYRSVADQIRAGKLAPAYEKYAFIGFNALTPVEKKLFDELASRQMADFYWDYDNFYLHGHEAGRFIRSNIREFASREMNIYDNLAQSKDIQFINTPYDIAQAKILPRLLNDFSPAQQSNPDQTAIILPDEQLLLPVLNSLPNDLSSVNVTMGYPVDATPAFSLLLSLISLQQNARQQGGGVAFYYQDVLAILNHQYMGIISNQQVAQIHESIHKHNKIYIGSEELHVHDLFRKIFTLPEGYRSLSDYLLEGYAHFYRLLKDKSSEEDESLKMELESIYHVYLSVKRLKEIFDVQQVEVRTETYLRILERAIKNQSIPFQGEPLSGMQVMGILETRSLDFENLIILSMNEGVFPTAESSPSFIPYNLRKGFGLPTHEHNDAIYAYYFYRLIQRARRVTLVYNSSTEGLKTGEMSRFMHQLLFESNQDIIQKTVVSGLGIPGEKTIEVAKTPGVMEQLERYNSLEGGGRTLSPSALKSYLVCTLRFYFRYLAGLKEPEEVSEEVDLPLFGSLLHNTLERIYGPYAEAGQWVDTGELRKLDQDTQSLEGYIMDAFRKEYFSDYPADQPLKLSGKNLLVKDIILQYIRQLLRAEQHFTPFRPLSLEGTYKGTLFFQAQGEQKQVTLEGTIDRVDEQEAGIRILDYKTGQSKGTFQDIPSLFDHKGQHDALQALIYARLYAQNHTPQKPLIPGLYYFREIYGPGFDYRLKMGKAPVTYGPVAKEMEKGLQEALSQLFDPAIPFVQTDDRNACRICPYAGICRREQG